MTEQQARVCDVVARTDIETVLAGPYIEALSEADWGPWMRREAKRLSTLDRGTQLDREDEEILRLLARLLAIPVE